MLGFSFNNSRMKEKLRRMAQASPAARRDALKILAGEVARKVVSEAPRDTNRFARGWALAAKSAGVGDRVEVPTVKSSKYADRAMEVLTRQTEKWNRIVARYERQGRVDKWYRAAVRRRDRAAEELGRFVRSEGTAIVFDLEEWQRRYRGRKLTTVRFKIYGGDGEIIEAGDRTYVVLRNREPHARLVEYRTGIMGKALASFRVVGLHRAGRVYIANVAAASGMAVTYAVA